MNEFQYNNFALLGNLAVESVTKSFDKWRILDEDTEKKYAYV